MNHIRRRRLEILSVVVCLVIAATCCQSYHKRITRGNSGIADKSFPYVAGDFHQHSAFTDGSWSLDNVMAQNNAYGLDWWTNSEHGGGFNRDGLNSGTDMGQTIYWDLEPGITILGTVAASGGHQDMWRWQSIRDFSFPKLLKLRTLYSDKTIMQGFEWNVPGHEHASTCIISGEFGKDANAKALAEFEYKFDGNDADLTGGAAQGWIKSTKTGHAKTIEAISWLQSNYAKASWVIPAHPERKSLYRIADFRDMNNAGPDVCFGFESMPGHQKCPERGEYKPSDNTYGRCTYGGCGYMAAKVGGLWDALLSEGRHWWLFANSDYHDFANDFYPGEYEKTYVYVDKKQDPQCIADGLRSGNSYVVCGDLIRELDFAIGSAMMGQTYSTRNDYVMVNIRIHNVKLNHLDIIAGKINGLINPNDSGYGTDSVTTTRVIARFDAKGNHTDGNGIQSQKWIDLGHHWILISARLPVNGPSYFRLRGTNWGLNEPRQTDANGNPLADTLEAPNTADKANADLWFYSNPVYVKVN